MEPINQLELFRIMTIVMDKKKFSEIKQVDKIVRRSLSARKTQRKLGSLCYITPDEMSVLKCIVKQAQ